MFYVLAFLLAIPSPVVVVLNAEALAIFVGLTGTHPWPLVMLTLAAGQCLTFVLLYLGGDGLARRWGWLRRRVDQLRADSERMTRYRAATEKWLFVAAVFGIPPLTALAALAPAFSVRLRVFLALALSGRLIRFGLLAGVPNTFSGLFPPVEPPDWLLALV